jgi:hypothetical protein
VTVTSPCEDDPSTASCPILNPSCINPNDTTLFGEPAVRLRSVIANAQNNDSSSICQSSYDAPVKSLLDMIHSATARGCLNTAVAARIDGTPDCVVEDVLAKPDGSVMITELPSCAEDGGVTPCWQLLDRLAEYESEGCTPPGFTPPQTCTLPPSCQPVVDPVDGERQLYSLAINRGTDALGNPLPPPPNTGTSIDCATHPPQ